MGEAVTGGPRLIAEGRVALGSAAVAEERVGAAFVNNRHPRTAVGVTNDGTLLLVTVDGRQPGFSRGATLPELAALLLKIGRSRSGQLRWGRLDDACARRRRGGERAVGWARATGFRRAARVRAARWGQR
jgi:hypothetical protein